MMIILISCLFSFNNARERRGMVRERERKDYFKYYFVEFLGFVLCFLNSKDHPK